MKYVIYVPSSVSLTFRILRSNIITMASDNDRDNEPNAFVQSLSSDDYPSCIQRPLPPSPISRYPMQASTDEHSIEINLSRKNLTDEDIQRMITNKEIPMNCTKIHLDGNSITHHGVSILVDLLKKSQVRQFWNHTCKMILHP